MAMANLPKLKVNKTAWTDEAIEIQEFEQARDFPYDQELIIVAEGHQINSYEDLVKLAGQERYKDKECLEIIILPMIVGG